MRRREFVVAATCIAAAWPVPALAGRVRTIGLIMANTEGDPEGQERVVSFRQHLSALGWKDGANVRIQVRWQEGVADRAKVYAKEFVDLPADVIVVNGSSGLAAVRQATHSIPIVFVVVADPVGSGFVQSLSRPGGNITGFSTFEAEMAGKWVELLKAVAPRVERLGVLVEPGIRGFSYLWDEVERIAPSFDMRASQLLVRDRVDIDNAILKFSERGGGGLVVLPTPTNLASRKRIFSLASDRRLPAIYPFSYWAKEGGLMAYGINSRDLFGRAASYVDRVLNGESPSDLPVQAPTQYELVINLKTAKTLGLTIPDSLLASADKVIE